MHIAITGNTSGLGKSLQENSWLLGHTTIGFSRTTGFDINDKKSRLEIIKHIDNCDVFVNNAYSNYGQIDMLYDVYSYWKNKQKTIVTIGSYASNAAEWRLQPCLYSTVKKALDVATYQLVNSHDRNGCKLMIFKPGYLGDNRGQITFDYAAKYLLDLISKNDHQLIEAVLK
jgi:NAD(P)-dependent dehydrogenase (short-subunit alcohol dehydrogenase family)